jgi:tRNA threonylcarbamoyladenosine biosynthesis protein TsaB
VIVAFSTSSPVASVALIGLDGKVLGSRAMEAPMKASGACIGMLEELLETCNIRLEDATSFLADLGPGSFTGVKVAVTLAKTLAFAQGVKTSGASSFDLIDPDSVVAFPSKKGEWFLRVPGQDVSRQNEFPSVPFKGFGPGVEFAVFPDASRFALLWNKLTLVDPEHLLPNYLIEPAITQPKSTLSPLGSSHG